MLGNGTHFNKKETNMDKGMMYNDDIEQYSDKKEAYDSGFNDGYIEGRHDSDEYLWRILHNVMEKGYDSISKMELLDAIKNYCSCIKKPGENK